MAFKKISKDTDEKRIKDLQALVVTNKQKLLNKTEAPKVLIRKGHDIDSGYIAQSYFKEGLRWIQSGVPNKSGGLADDIFCINQWGNNVSLIKRDEGGEKSNPILPSKSISHQAINPHKRYGSVPGNSPKKGQGQAGPKDQEMLQIDEEPQEGPMNQNGSIEGSNIYYKRPEKMSNWHKLQLAKGKGKGS
jgi:hypothetical protein